MPPKPWRVRPEPLKPTTILLPPNVVARARSRARADGIALADLVTDAIEAELRRLDKRDLRASERRAKQAAEAAAERGARRLARGKTR